MKTAILIDPRTHTVSLAESAWTLKEIQDATAGSGLVDVVTIEGLSIYIDDEGLMNDNQNYLWQLPGVQPIAGPAVVLGGVDDEGEQLDLSGWNPRHLLESIAAYIDWIDPTEECQQRERERGESEPMSNNELAREAERHYQGQGEGEA